MAEMTRDVALEIVEDSWSRLVNGAYSEDELSEAHGFAISDMKRVGELEAENKRLKDGIANVKAEIHTLDDLNPDYPMDRTIHVSKWAVIDIIDKYLGEVEQ